MEISLRRVEPADYQLIQRWQNDPEVFWLMDYEKPFSLEDIKESEEQAAREGVPFIIQADGRPIGRTGINQIRRRDAVAALYLMIGEPDARGRGYAKPALQAVLDYGFNTMNLRLIWLLTLSENERAIGLYKSVGFSIDATLRDRSVLGGRTLDHICMSTTREEFMSR
ncbi:MAG: GNAT family N-acetyltransferase [Actinomycetota bacterium]